MYITLSGARKNLGDYLITHRATRLLERIKGEPLVQLKFWDSLDEHRDLVNEARAVVVLGGPGLQQRMWPEIYRLTRDLADLAIPVAFLGIGAFAPAVDPAVTDAFRLSPETRSLLRLSTSHGIPIAVRDHYGQALLHANGIDDSVVTGCPVWYDESHLGAPMTTPASISRLVFTPPQAVDLFEQTVQILDIVAGMFPRAERICAFHRGIGTGTSVTPTEAASTLKLQRVAAGLGFEALDVSGDLSGLARYDDADLHIGYRVHGHLYFLSMRKPSILIHEDGRGLAADQTLGIDGIEAFDFSASRYRTYHALSPLHLNGPFYRLLPFKTVRPTAAAELQALLNRDLKEGFRRIAPAAACIDSHYATMKTFIETLP